MDLFIFFERSIFALTFVLFMLGLVFSWKTSKTPNWVVFGILAGVLIFSIIYFGRWMGWF